MTLGPSFNMKRWGVDKSRAFVYAIGDLAYLGYDPYFTAPGVGAPDFELRGGTTSKTTRTFPPIRYAPVRKPALARRPTPIT